jgi:methylglyoxal synthase
MVDTASAITEHENLKKGLLNFIRNHETLIDYFAIIGFENA